MDSSGISIKIYLVIRVYYYLRTQEEDGYVTRTIFSEIPPRVEYALTERAKSLQPILDSLLQWSVDNMDDIMCDRKKNTPVKG